MILKSKSAVVTGSTGRRKLVGVSGVTVEQAGRVLRL